MEIGVDKMLVNKEKALLSGFCAAVFILFSGFSGKCENISEKVLRFHIIANSDSDEDQTLKVNVRDRVLKDCSKIFELKKDLEESIIAAEENLDVILKSAEDEIQKRGYSYEVKAEIVDMPFSTRHYNEVTLPAGIYKAVRITIGKGRGQNWWCVMFPPMCLPAAQEKNELKDVLTPEELDLVDSGEKYEIKFKTWEIIESVRKWIYSIFIF